MRSLAKKIFLYTFVAALVLELLCFAFAFWSQYDLLNKTTEASLRNQAYLLAQTIANENKPIDAVSALGTDDTRVTLIDVNGDVLYDSEDASENHDDRPEIVLARRLGEASEVRFSTTTGEVTHYFAILLADKSVLRVATTNSQIIAVLASLALPYFAVMIVIAAAALIFSRWSAGRYVAPLLAINLDAPLESDIYSEISPLLERMEEQKQRIIEHLDDAEKTRRELTANVSHQLKTPLTVISGYSELMRECKVKPDDVPYFAGLVYSEATHMQKLVADLLVLAQMDENRISANENGTVENLEKIDLSAVAAEIIDRLTPFAEQNNVSFHLESSGVVIIYGSAPMIDSLVYNLCENAIRYNRDGGKVTVNIAGNDEEVLFEVIDTGIGIAAQEQARVFERFYRVDKTHSRQTGGTGLGLAIVKNVALAHGAKLLMDSAPDKGTTVSLVFPVRR